MLCTHSTHDWLRRIASIFARTHKSNRARTLTISYLLFCVQEEYRLEQERAHVGGADEEYLTLRGQLEEMRKESERNLL
jgi:hypothetical protein